MKSAGVVLGCVVLVAASSALAEDWPQWRGPDRDARVAGFTAPAAWPKAPTQKWKVTVGTGDSTPALVGDRLYVSARQEGDEVTLCLEAATGKEVWKDKYPTAAMTGPSAAHSGPRSSPAVADGKVCALGVNGILSCLDAAKGTVVWRKDSTKEGFAAGPRFGAASSPLIVDGMCVVQLGGGDSGALVAYDLAKGDLKWKWAAEPPDFASPAVMTAEGTKMIVALTVKSVVGVAAADGKLLWQVPFAAERMSYNAPSPVIDGATVIFTGQGRGMKAVKIEKQGDAFAAKDLWSIPDLATQYNTPVLNKDGLLFGLAAGAGGMRGGGMKGGGMKGGGGKGGGGGGGGSLFCVDTKTGKTAWRDATARGSNFGTVVDAGAALFALTSGGELLVFQPSKDAYTELTKYRVSEKAVYSYPVVAGNRVFVEDQDSVTLWTIE